MSGVVAALAWALLHSLWQLALVGLLAKALLAAAGPGRFGLQYRIAMVALALCLLLPALTFIHGLAPGPAADLPGAAMSAFQGPQVSGQPGPAVPVRATVLVWVSTHLGWIALGWAIGVVAMGLRLGGGWLATQRWRQNAVAAPAPWDGRFQALALALGAGRRVLILATEQVATPMALGLWRPVVLVPAALFSGLPAPYLEALLAHELAHIARLDYLFNFIQSVIEVLCFHHPVVWWLSRRIRILREHLCDDLAAKAIGEPRRLALALDALDDVQPLLNPLALAARGGPLFDRIQHLLKPQPAPVSGPWALALVLAILVPGAALLARSRTDAAPIAGRPETVAYLDALAAKEGLDPQLLRSIAWAESGLDPKAKSSVGALGLLQVTPATARKFGAEDLTDADAVAAAGARYLKFLLTRYNGNTARAVTAYPRRQSRTSE